MCELVEFEGVGEEIDLFVYFVEFDVVDDVIDVG